MDLCVCVRCHGHRPVIHHFLVCMCGPWKESVSIFPTRNSEVFFFFVRDFPKYHVFIHTLLILYSFRLSLKINGQQETSTCRLNWNRCCVREVWWARWKEREREMTGAKSYSGTSMADKYARRENGRLKQERQHHTLTADHSPISPRLPARTTGLKENISNPNSLNDSYSVPFHNDGISRASLVSAGIGWPVGIIDCPSPPSDKELRWGMHQAYWEGKVRFTWLSVDSQVTRTCGRSYPHMFKIWIFCAKQRRQY
jgi:hypothetical protein